MEIKLKEGDWAEIDYEWRIADGNWHIPTKAIKFHGKGVIILEGGRIEKIELKGGR